MVLKYPLEMEREGQLLMKQNDSVKKNKFLNKIMLLLGSGEERRTGWATNSVNGAQLFYTSVQFAGLFIPSEARQAVSTHLEEFVTCFSILSFACWKTSGSQLPPLRTFPLCLSSLGRTSTSILPSSLP